MFEARSYEDEMSAREADLKQATSQAAMIALVYMFDRQTRRG
jgi:hypothetical protein